MQLKNLLITNFRSIRGTVAVPLDAPVILLHGSNGLGKTSILSAIELALTGDISHLRRVDNDYQKHLLNRESEDGTVSIFVRGQEQSPRPIESTITLGPSSFSGKPLLDEEDSRFFSERCYLPQSALGRLLELYQDANTDEQTSPLTQFVKDLLGLDQLDALIEGLNAAFHVARVRNLVSEFRRLENLRNSVEAEIQLEKAKRASVESAIASERSQIEGLLREYSRADLIQRLTEPKELIREIEEDTSEATELSFLTSARQELEAYQSRHASLPRDVEASERNALEKDHTEVLGYLDDWLSNDGLRLTQLVSSLGEIFPDLPSPQSSDPVRARDLTEQRVLAEKERCERVLTSDAASAQRLRILETDFLTSQQKLQETENELKRLSEHADAHARALAGILPFVHDEDCPVCGRDFSELNEGPLSAKISAAIAALTTQSGRLKFLTNIRLEEAAKQSAIQQEQASLRSAKLPPQDVANLSLRVATLTEAQAKLATLKDAAKRGADLMRRESELSDRLVRSRRRNQDEAQLASGIEAVRRSLQAYDPPARSTLGDLLASLLQLTSNQITSLRDREEKRRLIVRRLATLIDKLEQVGVHAETNKSANSRLTQIQSAAAGVDQERDEAKLLANAARRARSNIVGRVFNTALNKVWRDLFVRLAPQEKFVPRFKLASTADEPVEAGLETIHRSGELGGPPGTMLSAGNLNTAALTLFLSLHLSVRNRLPWLILDDPVQSMDDVHIAQFAALLRRLTKTMGKQVIIAVHDRALFDYLSLELSPAFQDDRLITVELSRTLAGETIGTPTVITYSPDGAIAA